MVTKQGDWMTIELTGVGPAGSGNWGQIEANTVGPLKVAAFGAMKDLAAEVSRLGRRSIRVGGFSERWQNAFRVRMYPSNKPSLRTVVYAYHKIDYAGIFDAGGTVRGRPFLWIPTKNAPVPLGRQRKITPARFVKQFGPLSSSRKSERSKRVILFGRIPGSRRRVPMFIGVELIRQRKRFDIDGAVNVALEKFDGFWKDNLEQAFKDQR